MSVVIRTSKDPNAGSVGVAVMGSAIKGLLLDAGRAFISDAADDGAFAASLGILCSL